MKDINGDPLLILSEYEAQILKSALSDLFYLDDDKSNLYDKLNKFLKECNENQ